MSTCLLVVKMVGTVVDFGLTDTGIVVVVSPIFVDGCELPGFPLAVVGSDDVLVAVVVSCPPPVDEDCCTVVVNS